MANPRYNKKTTNPRVAKAKGGMVDKGDPYESIKDTDTEVDMKDMAAVFSKGDDDGFMDVLIGPKRAGIRFKKKFFKGGLVRSGKPKIATKGWR
jgi:hypothetical protein